MGFYFFHVVDVFICHLDLVRFLILDPVLSSWQGLNTDMTSFSDIFMIVKTMFQFICGLTLDTHPIFLIANLSLHRFYSIFVSFKQDRCHSLWLKYPFKQFEYPNIFIVSTKSSKSFV